MPNKNDEASAVIWKGNARHFQRLTQARHAPAPAARAPSSAILTVIRRELWTGSGDGRRRPRRDNDLQRLVTDTHFSEFPAF